MIPKITLTLDLTPETITALHTFLKEVGKDTPDPAQMSFDDYLTPSETTPALKPVTFTDLRAKALVFSQTNQQPKLKELFAKYGAKKLSDITEDNFSALLTDMEVSLNG